MGAGSQILGDVSRIMGAGSRIMGDISRTVGAGSRIVGAGSRIMVDVSCTVGAGSRDTGSVCEGTGSFYGITTYRFLSGNYKTWKDITNEQKLYSAH